MKLTLNGRINSLPVGTDVKLRFAGPVKQYVRINSVELWGDTRFTNDLTATLVEPPNVSFQIYKDFELFASVQLLPTAVLFDATGGNQIALLEQFKKVEFGKVVQNKGLLYNLNGAGTPDASYIVIDYDVVNLSELAEVQLLYA